VRERYDRIDADFESHSVPDAVLDGRLAELLALEVRIAAIPAATGAGFAAKLLTVTNHGEFDLGDYELSILTEAEKMTGLGTPPSIRRRRLIEDAR
jgi:hypothetical protein